MLNRKNGDRNQKMFFPNNFFCVRGGFQGLGEGKGDVSRAMWGISGSWRRGLKGSHDSQDRKKVPD